MKKNIFVFYLAIFLTSCYNGKIEYTESPDCKNGEFPSQGAFLVNTSQSNRIQFTIKSYPNNQSNVVTNTTYILEPGAQTFLGCMTFEHDYHYEIVGEREMK